MDWIPSDCDTRTCAMPGNAGVVTCMYVTPEWRGIRRTCAAR